MEHRDTRATTGQTTFNFNEVEKQTADVLEPSIDSKEWKVECNRVSKQLTMPIKIKTSDQGGLEDFYHRKQTVMEHLQRVEEFTIGQVPIMIDMVIEGSKKDLKKIKKKEQKLNTQN